MAAKDIFHPIVRSALEKEGWTITDDPLYLKVDEDKLYVDLGAENNLLGAEKYGQKIAVEIKSFLGISLISDFHEAMGQAWNYKVVLEELEPNRVLYLAIPKDIYEEFFTRRLAKISVTRMQLNLLIFNPIGEEIVTWT
ncbi:MAG: fatty-acid oxidation protein subunit alpha [Okeania sp. SIO2C9]|uniref:XisH family protein n=1 Tax=Okeania sp. SIO2C9 TaxID=2607791 RepID=UPI0013BF1EBC|nr:XisH family protein [Okeania sp. SIO2C9]NEQ76332.1 fatty-acid oxidation protein subunit alpha [Okeania sp. SIO2C9]